MVDHASNNNNVISVDSIRNRLDRFKKRASEEKKHSKRKEDGTGSRDSENIKGGCPVSNSDTNGGGEENERPLGVSEVSDLLMRTKKSLSCKRKQLRKGFNEELDEECARMARERRDQMHMQQKLESEAKLKMLKDRMTKFKKLEQQKKKKLDDTPSSQRGSRRQLQRQPPKSKRQQSAPAQIGKDRDKKNQVETEKEDDAVERKDAERKKHVERRNVEKEGNGGDDDDDDADDDDDDGDSDDGDYDCDSSISSDSCEELKVSHPSNFRKTKSKKSSNSDSDSESDSTESSSDSSPNYVIPKSIVIEKDTSIAQTTISKTGRPDLLWQSSKKSLSSACDSLPQKPGRSGRPELLGQKSKKSFASGDSLPQKPGRNRSSGQLSVASSTKQSVQSTISQSRSVRRIVAEQRRLRQEQQVEEVVSPITHNSHSSSEVSDLKIPSVVVTTASRDDGATIPSMSMHGKGIPLDLPTCSNHDVTKQSLPSRSVSLKHKNNHDISESYHISASYHGSAFNDKSKNVLLDGDSHNSTLDSSGSFAYELGAHLKQKHENCEKDKQQQQQPKVAVDLEQIHHDHTATTATATATTMTTQTDLDSMTMEVTEDDKHFFMWLDVPGIMLQDLEVNLNVHGILHVTGHRKNFSSYNTGHVVISTIDKKFEFLNHSRLEMDNIQGVLLDYGVLIMSIPKRDNPEPVIVPVKKASPPSTIYGDDEDNQQESGNNEKYFITSLDIPGVKLDDLNVQYHQEVNLTYNTTGKFIVSGKRRRGKQKPQTIRKSILVDKIFNTSNIIGYLNSGVLTIVATHLQNSHDSTSESQQQTSSRTITIMNEDDNNHIEQMANESEAVQKPTNIVHPIVLA